MNAENLRVALAERCGWFRVGPYTVGRSGNQRTIIKGIHPHTSRQSEIPDYTRSLDAVASAERVLNPCRVSKGGAYPPESELWDKYVFHLLKTAEMNNESPLHSSALTRAVALGLTWGLITAEQATELLREGV